MPATPPPPALDETPAATEPDEGESTSLYVPLPNWEFIDEVPTPETVRTLLESLPDQWGVKVADYLDYVQALPANKKIKVEVPRSDGQGTQRVEQFVAIYTLYMTVAGREQMLRAAAEINGWRVDLEPAVIPNQLPGFLAFDIEGDRPIVYRETCTIWRNEIADGSPVQIMLGTKSGTAWVPGTGRQQAAKSNPVEKVETAARGRAIAAWGIGVLPGSGVASVEEMLYRTQPAVKARGTKARRSRDDLVDEILTTAERVRQLREIEPEEMRDRIASYASEQFDRTIQREDGTIDFDKLRDAHLVLVLGMLEQAVQRLEGQQDTTAPDDSETN